MNVSAKLKSIAAGTTKSFDDDDTLIKAIRMSDTLPENLTPADENTISLATSRYPVYIWFDNTNDAGIIYVYTEAKEILMNLDSSSMFYCFSALTGLSGLASWDTSSVTNMYAMFFSAESLTDLSPLASWDTGSVTNMSTMFSSAYSLTDLSPLASWDTGSVTNMSSMFSGYDTTSLTDLSPLVNWDTSSVTDMSWMFYNATSLTNLSSLANWDASSVTNMEGMFRDASSLTDLSPLANWDTSSVTNMYAMFYGAASLTQAGVDAINAWDITNVSDFKYMFGNVPYHPTFTKRQGTWNSEGTFTPSS